MLYGYLISEGFLSKAKDISEFKILKSRYNYLVSHKQLEMYVDEIDKGLKKINPNNLGKADRQIYNQIKSKVDSIINTRKAKLKADADAHNAWISKFKDAPTWEEGNTQEVVKYINSKIIPVLLQPDYKKKIQEAIDKEMNKKPSLLDKIDDKGFPKIKASMFEEDIIEVLQDTSQGMNIVLCGLVTNPIADVFNAGTGDGDEGCIYR